MSRFDIHGKDLRFPLKVDAHGGLSTVSGLENVRQGIITIIDTFVGEILYAESIGVGLAGFLHRKGPNMVTRVTKRIKDQILEHEARVEFLDISGEIDHENKRLIINVTYYDLIYHHEDNIIYPISLEEYLQ